MKVFSLGSSSRLAKLVLIVGAMSLVMAAHAQKDEEMDHEMDFDFDDGDADIIPVTPEESNEDGAPDGNYDDDLIVPHHGDSSSDDDNGWMAYIEYGKKYVLRIAKYVSVKISRIILTQEHKPSQSNSEAFKYGLYEGLFKLQPRANSNCLTDGPTYLIALTHITGRIFKNHLKVSQQEEFAFEDVLQGFVNKCTLQDTLPATMMLNFLMFAIDELPDPYRDYMRKYRILIRLIDAWGMMISVTEIADAFGLLGFKTDGFVVGKLLGVLIKVAVQFKLNIITGNQSYLDRETSFSNMLAF